MWSRFINSDSWWLFESWGILRFHSPFLQGFSWLHHLEREAWDPEVTLFFRVSKIQKSIEICEFTFRLLDLGPGFIFKFGQRFLWPAWGLHHDILVHFQYAITMLGCWSFLILVAPLVLAPSNWLHHEHQHFPADIAAEMLKSDWEKISKCRRVQGYSTNSFARQSALPLAINSKFASLPIQHESLVGASGWNLDSETHDDSLTSQQSHFDSFWPAKSIQGDSGSESLPRLLCHHILWTHQNSAADVARIPSFPRVSRLCW